MANIDQVGSQIRFGLEQLSAKNAHHEFEHLCRHLTRARICSNILLATGPVSAGGDQGRDFETFRTYLNSTSIANSTFIGLASAKPIAFACSLQSKSGISAKIKSDVKTIMTSGSEIEAVHYFCGADLEVAKRHKLKIWARKNYSTELEVHDGQSISELLADREIFWIAEKYLSIPGEVFPRSSENDGGIWYSTVFSEWKDREPTGDNYSEFAEIKIAARHAFYTESLKQDLPFWVDLLGNFINSRFSELKRRAIYEVCVLSLRGFNNLDGYEEHLRWFFSQIPDLNAVGLQDAEILLTYCGGAILRGILQMSPEEISNWHHQVVEQIDKKLEEDIHYNTRATLLNLKGWASTRVNPLEPERPNFEKGIEWWLKLVEVLESAPMFPLKQFANNVADLLQFIIDLNGKDKIPETYFELTEKLDTLLAKRLGGFTAAESSRKRAFLLRDNGRVIDAIDLLHRSKLDWFASETLEEALSMMLFLSRAYMELGLFFAAKYYALAVAFIAENNSQAEVKHFISVGLMRAATWDYIIGAFCSFLNITEIEIKIHHVHARDAGDLENNSELYSIVLHLITLKAISERINPEFDKLISERIDKWLPKEWVDALLPTSRQTLHGMTDEQVREHLANELLGTPFGDLKSERKVAWSALGIEWNVSWKNDYETTIQAEQFLAILQVYLVEIAQSDLCLLKTSVEISVEITDEQVIELQPLSSNKNRVWKIRLPQSSTHSPTDLGRKHAEIFSAASDILFEISLLPEDKYFQVTENLFNKGLNNRIFVAQPYEVLYNEVIRAEDFNQFNRTITQNDFSKFEVPLFEHEELSWNDQPGPTYTWEQAEQHLKNRYENGLPDFQLTMEILRNTVDFEKIVNELREENWLDWQIVYAITSVAMNYQYTPKTKGIADRQKLDEIWKEVMSGKTRWAIVPPDEFNKDKMLLALRISMLHTVQLLGLELHQITPDFEAIDDFLRHRYKYWIDDVPHEDPFKNIN